MIEIIARPLALIACGAGLFALAYWGLSKYEEQKQRSGLEEDIR